MDINEKLMKAYDSENHAKERAYQERLDEVKIMLAYKADKADEIVETARTASQTSFFKTLPEVKNKIYHFDDENTILNSWKYHTLGVSRFNYETLYVEGGGCCGNVDLIYDGKLRFITNDDKHLSYSAEGIAEDERLFKHALDRYTTFTLQLDTFYTKFYEAINKYIEERDA